MLLTLKTDRSSRDFTENRLTAVHARSIFRAAAQPWWRTGPRGTVRLWQPITTPSPWPMGRHRKVRDDTEVVARPDAVQVLVEGSFAVEDFQGRPMDSAPNQDVVNAAPQL